MLLFQITVIARNDEGKPYCRNATDEQRKWVRTKELKPLRVKMNCSKGNSNIHDEESPNLCAPDEGTQQADGPNDGENPVRYCAYR